MEYAVIGKRIPSIEAWDKAAGAGQYASDVSLPGMLWAKVLRSPLPHARILSVDTSRAERLKGVRAVLTASDCPDARFGHMIHDETILAIFDPKIQVGLNPIFMPQLRDKIRFFLLGTLCLSRIFVRINLPHQSGTRRRFF